LKLYIALATTVLLLACSGCSRSGSTWYRAVVSSDDKVEAVFLLRVPAGRGTATFKVGGYEVTTDATFEGGTLSIPMPVHQTVVQAKATADGSLVGTFVTRSRAFGASTLALRATPIAAPTSAVLATVAGAGAVVTLAEPRTAWRLAMTESGVAKLILTETGPGSFEGVVSLDTGNLIYVSGNGRGDAIVMTGFDGTSGYRLELALASDRATATGRLFGGHRFEWRETFSATRGADFALPLKLRATNPDGKIVLPANPALAKLPPGPLLVELAGSWCSTCRNAAPFIGQLDRDYRAKGLTIVTLLYEFTDDPKVDAKQAALFKQTYNVTWLVVPVAGSVDDFAEIVPAGLTDLNPAGFPISLFLAPDRTLVAVHAGFPAADDDPAAFAAVSAEFRANVEHLLALPR
jgi:thiol-disulfide isomerase/thioredoxin